MSTDEHDSDLELDCTAVLADVWLMLDGECDEATRARLQHHLDHCAACIEAYGIEEKLKHMLSRKCGADRAPDSLTVEIRRSISIRYYGTSTESAES